MGYGSFGTEFDAGSFIVAVNINSTGLNTYGNAVYASNGSYTGGATTSLVIIPAFQSGQLIVTTTGQFFDTQVSITIVQVDNN